MRFGVLAATVVGSLATAAQADRLGFEETNKVLASGTVISAAPVTAPPAPNPVLGAQPPEATRIHEVFLAFEGEVYFCYLHGGKSDGVQTYAECYD
ncbi:hypothetical protein [Roseivivax isoporae]|nr:hypothetical protein [Roseivivax isoporae]